MSRRDQWAPLHDVGPWQLRGFVLGPLGLMAAEVSEGRPGVGAVLVVVAMVGAVAYLARLPAFLAEARRERSGR